MLTPLDGVVLFVIALVSLVLARRNLDKRGKDKQE
jgi:membrane protein implicated in regulation of membrane protease activity